MNDIHEIAKDLGVELTKQGEQVKDVVGTMDEAKDNVEKGNF
jgi:hypothetical protein